MIKKLMENGKFALKAEAEYPVGEMPLYRLVAMRDVGGDVKAGDLGGLLGGPYCLSEDGDCWVYPGGLVYAGARVTENAIVGPGAHASTGAALRGSSRLTGSLRLIGDFELRDGEALDGQDVLLVNVILSRLGQYVLEGQSVFVVEYARADGISDSISLPAGQCGIALRAYLACRQPGDRVAFLQMAGEPAQRLPLSQDGEVPFSSIEKLLTQAQAF